MSVAEHRWRVRNTELVSGLGLVALVNGIAPDAVASVLRHGYGGAGFRLFGADPVTLIACAVGIGLASGGLGRSVSRGDLFAGLVAAMIVLLPHRAAGWMALGAVGGYGVIAFRRDTRLFAAAVVFLAVSMHEVWGRLALAGLAPWLTRFDAALTAEVLGMLRSGVSLSGNVIGTGAGYDLVIVAACVSLKPISQALLCCFAFTRAVRPAWRSSEFATWMLLVLCVTALNTGRLTLYGLDLTVYAFLHDGAGRPLFGTLVLTVALALAAWGVRHELGIGRSRR